MSAYEFGQTLLPILFSGALLDAGWAAPQVFAKLDEGFGPVGWAYLAILIVSGLMLVVLLLSVL